MAAYDFFDKMGNGYIVPSSLYVTTGEPIDIRNTCELVSDFDELADLGFEFRYDGLITYEISTQSWKGCRLTADGTFEWIDMLQANGADLSGFAKVDHTHIEYLPMVSDNEPDAKMPQGHVWIDPVN